MPKVIEHAKDKPEAEERPRTSILDAAQNQWKNPVSLPILARAKSHVQVFELISLFIVILLSCRPS